MEDESASGQDGIPCPALNGAALCQPHLVFRSRVTGAEASWSAASLCRFQITPAIHGGRVLPQSKTWRQFRLEALPRFEALLDHH